MIINALSLYLKTARIVINFILVVFGVDFVVVCGGFVVVEDVRGVRVAVVVGCGVVVVVDGGKVTVLVGGDTEVVVVVCGCKIIVVGLVVVVAGCVVVLVLGGGVVVVVFVETENVVCIEVLMIVKITSHSLVYTKRMKFYDNARLIALTSIRWTMSETQNCQFQSVQGTQVIYLCSKSATFY